jgi:hypothetical protein
MMQAQALVGPSANPGSPPIAAGTRILDIDAEQFRSNFNRVPFIIRHGLAGHALFTLPRLIELAKRQPPESLEYYAGNVGISMDFDKTPHTGLSVEETIRRIEECCSWLFLKRIEHDPEYNQLLNQVLDEIGEHSELLSPGMYDRAGAIFVSSPNAVTPYHMDQENNFLLQIRGTKTIHVFPGNDPTVLSQEEMEEHYCRPGINRNVVFKEEYRPKAWVFQLNPGDTLHFPNLYPHYVQNGPEVSISFSCAFFTPATERREIIHRVNHGLRRLGLTPTPFGHSSVRDSTKVKVYRVWRRLRRLWRKDAL